MSSNGKYRLIALPNRVQLWSSKRLPFEPRDWQLEMRNELKSALKALKSDSEILYACYQSVKEDFVDVENVLFYNVGSGTFSGICGNGLVFERGFENPPVTEDDVIYEHYQVYVPLGKEQKSASKRWRQKRALSRWKGIEFDGLSSSTKARDIWYSMARKGRGEIWTEQETGLVDFGIDLGLKVSHNAVGNPVNIIKVLLDGIIAAFQVHNGENTDEVSQILARQLKKDEEEIRRLLLRAERGIFGKSRLLKRFRGGLQWNPADDRLVYCRIMLNRSEDVERGKVSCSGEIFEVERC